MKENIRKILITCLSTALLLTILTGCAMKSPVTGTQFVMDTVVSITLYDGDEGNVNDIEELLKDYEQFLLAEVPADIREELNELIADTDGAFDHRIGKLISLWGIGTDHARVPTDEEINAVLDDRSQMHPGAYGKGYACDVLKAYLDEHHIKGACIAVGGSVLCYGSHDGKDEYTVAIRDPRGEATDYIGVIKVKDQVVSTSGDYERVFEQDGRRYHHILDPHTGYPVESNLASVTVVSGSGFLSDALSTAAFSLGKERGMKLLEDYGAEGVFIDTDMNIYTTDGIEFEALN